MILVLERPGGREDWDEFICLGEQSLIGKNYLGWCLFVGVSFR